MLDIFLDIECTAYNEESVSSNNIHPNLLPGINGIPNNSNCDEKKQESVKFIDSQRPGLHISTILRQIMFDVLYGVEFVILLSFGFSSDVKVKRSLGKHKHCYRII